MNKEIYFDVVEHIKKKKLKNAGRVILAQTTDQSGDLILGHFGVSNDSANLFRRKCLVF